MKNGFPYEKFQSTQIWDIINQAIDDLVENTDIEEKTERNYIVGFLCKALYEAGISN